MKNIIARKTEIGILTILIALAISLRLVAQAPAEEEACRSLDSASPFDLLQFLTQTVPDERNGWCVTSAIQKLGYAHYSPAVPVLVKLLDFRRPPTRQEAMGFYVRLQGIPEFFPAVKALRQFGKAALPEVLRAIEADSTSQRARENALFVWMQEYKHDRPKGIALLNEEKTKARDVEVRARLDWTVQKALIYCNPPEQSSCREAAGK